MQSTQPTSGNDRRPLVPSDISPARSLRRACWAALLSNTQSKNPVDTLRRTYPDDPVGLALLQRAAITGATTTVPGWASELAGRGVSEWLPSLAPASAAAALIARGITIPLSGVATMHVPGRASAPSAVPWVGEGGAIAVRADTIAAATLAPRKVAVIVAMSRELLRFGVASQTMFDALLREDAAISLDTAYFSATAGSAIAHAGLLNGLVAGAGSAVMADDLAKLAEAVGAGGSGDVVFIASPGREAATDVRAAITGGDVDMLASLALPVDRVIAIDPGALVHSFGPDPEILVSDDATLHMSDTPTDIGLPGAPTIVAAPTQSMFQTAQVAMRMILDIAFATRRTGAVAFMDGCSW
jgi:hypothetical protein